MEVEYLHKLVGSVWTGRSGSSLPWPLLRATLEGSVGGNETSERQMNEMEYIQRKLIREGDAVGREYDCFMINMCLYIF